MTAGYSELNSSLFREQLFTCLSGVTLTFLSTNIREFRSLNVTPENKFAVYKDKSDC